MKRLSLLALIMLSGLFLAISCKEPAPAPEPIPEPDPVLDTKDFMLISWEGGIYSTDIEYNTDFDVTIDAESQPWVEFIQTKATSHGELEFRFAANAETIFNNGLSREDQFAWWKKDFCKKSTVYLYLNNFTRKEMLYDPSDSNGRTAFNDFKIEGRRVTLTLAPGQMVIFSNAL